MKYRKQYTKYRLRYLSIIILMFVFGSSFSQNTLKINNSTINISGGAFLTCKGSIVLENTGQFVNNGTILLENDWINNSSDIGFIGTDTGKVILYGDTQNIAGLDITNFYKLELQGNNLKRLGINSIIEDSLILNNIEFATDSFKLFVTNTDTGIISRTSGFVSSLDTGCLIRNTNLTENYIFPVGSNFGTTRYRPVEVLPNNASANSYSVRFANTDATSENFDINSKEPGIGNVNPFWYHRINRVSGTSSADISIYKTVGTNDEAMAHWENTLWMDMGAVTSVPEKVTKLSWDNFDTTAFVLTTKKPIIQANNDTTICIGEDLQLNVNIISSEGGPYAYYWSPLTYLNDSSIVNPYATNVLGNIEYIVEVFDSTAMAMSYPDTVFVTVYPAYNETDAASICSGDTLFWGNDTLTISGDYVQIFSSLYGCDSTVTMTLTKDTAYNETDIVTICQGESYTFGTQTLTTAGIYTEIFDPITSICDSTVELTLYVDTVYNETITDTICDGETYVFGTQTLTVAGVYQEVFTATTTSCDSTVELTLYVDTVYNETITDTICDGETYVFGTQTLTVAGVYQEVFTAITTSCDSTVTLTLLVGDKYTLQIDTTICSNDSIYLDGAWQNTTGTYIDDLLTSLGCDSTITTNLTVIPSPIITISSDTTLCVGVDYTITATGGTNYLWNTGETTSSIVVSPNISTSYFVTVSNADCSDNTSTTVDIHPEPIAVDDTVFIAQNDENVITNIFSNDTYTFANYTIVSNPQNGIASMLINGIVNYTPSEYYYGDDYLTYRLTDSICPNYYDEANVYYIISNDEALLIPNAITPNGDGIHDYFDIGGILNYPESELIIFNRWGNEIYSSKPYKNDWYGTGKDGVTILPNGTYYYVLKLNDTKNKTFSGYIELVK